MKAIRLIASVLLSPLALLGIFLLAFGWLSLTLHAMIAGDE